jgi:hypothetical protein
MTERYGSGSGEEGHRPSGRGAVTERLARQSDGAHEIDLTEEATARAADEDTARVADEDSNGAAAARDGDQADRASSGAFEPASPVVPAADPPAEATRQESSSIFDLDERDQQEDQHPTGYEPPVGDTDADRPREVGADSGEITPTPVPAHDPPAGTPVPEGLPEPPSPAATGTAAADTPAATGTASADTPAAEAIPAAEAAPAPEGAPGSPLASLDVAGIRNRFIDIQAGFVDEPRQAVEEAGRFVDDLVQQVADALRQQRGQLAGPDGSTEDLRLALRAHRQFVDRLLDLAT